MNDHAMYLILRTLFFSLLLFVASCASTSSTRQDVSSNDYRLGEGDQIAIQVFDEPDLTMEARIGASGIINYSYLGDVKVSGKSPQELEQELIALLSDGYLVNPSVNVSIRRYRPFYINGEVRQPGSYSYEPGLTLEKAIVLAGGLTDRASTRKMSIVRAGLAQSESEKASFSTVIAPGDVISIKEGFF